MSKTSLNTAEPEANKPASERWLRRSLSRARARLTHAISGAQPAAAPAVAAQGESADATQTVETVRGRLRRMLQQDRDGAAAVSPPQPTADSAPRSSITPPPLPPRADSALAEAPRGSAQILADPKLAATKAKLANAKSRLAAAKAQLAERSARLAREEAAAEETPSAAHEPEAQTAATRAAPEPEAPADAPAPAAPLAVAGAEPIRTRTMARLLALQGYPERALSIYDELLAAEGDPTLLAEAEELRAHQTEAS